jgi:hypothetical protein
MPPPMPEMPPAYTPPAPAYVPPPMPEIPQQPAYTPPPMPEMPPMPPEIKKRSSILSVLIAIIAVIIIAVLAFLIYYYSTKPYGGVPISPDVTVKPQPVKPVVPAVTPTNVITFAVPEVLPTTTKSGTCVASIAEPYRVDTYRCSVGTAVYDPCFSTSQSGVAYCPVDPTTDGAILVKTSKALAQKVPPAVMKDNWAWFIKLEDGTLLSPFTGTKPIVDGTAALYGGKITNGERPVLVGELVKGNVWTVQEKILVKNGTVWVTKSSRTAKVDTVWQ